MFETIKNIFKRTQKRELLKPSSKEAAKERLHLVLMQDRANVSADFLDLMVKEIVDVIKKYIDIDEDAIDVRLTNETDDDGVQGVPALYANIPIINIKDETRKLSKTNQENKLNHEPPKHEVKKEDISNEEEKKIVEENEEPKEEKELKENSKKEVEVTQKEESKEENKKGESKKSESKKTSQNKKTTKSQEEKTESENVQKSKEIKSDEKTEQVSKEEQKNIKEEKKNEE